MQNAFVKHQEPKRYYISPKSGFTYFIKDRENDVNCGVFTSYAEARTECDRLNAQWNPDTRTTTV